MNYQEKINEIAESFVNGNISWCKARIGNQANICLDVLKELEEMGNPYNSVESFKRIFSI